MSTHTENASVTMSDQPEGLRSRALGFARGLSTGAKERGAKLLGKTKEWALSATIRFIISAAIASAVALSFGAGIGSVISVAVLTKIFAASLLGVGWTATINHLGLPKVGGWIGFLMRLVVGAVGAAGIGACVGYSVDSLDVRGTFKGIDINLDSAKSWAASWVDGDAWQKSWDTFWQDRASATTEALKHNTESLAANHPAPSTPTPEAPQPYPGLPEQPAAPVPVEAPVAPTVEAAPTTYTAGPNDGVTQMMAGAPNAPELAPSSTSEFYRWAVANGIYGVDGSPVIPTGAVGYYDANGAFWIDLNPADATPAQMAVDSQGNATSWLKSLPRR